ncbi:trehalose-phosphatase [Arthrobacter polaris]|uniref:trehalose-phosphatase n=1 Tax=Arthrobacter polaris TaxID=2813727 RepID=UPI002AFDCA5C|nr:hypothetical protein [Arthrobacter polaris]
MAGLESTTTALVSGRALDSLRTVATPPAPTLLVGSHGAETWWGPDSPALELNNAQHSALALAQAAVDQAINDFPGTVAEQKPAGLSFITGLPTQLTGRAPSPRSVKHWQNPQLHLTTGKMVLEISVINANKGQSLTALRAFSGATAAFLLVTTSPMSTPSQRCFRAIWVSKWARAAPRQHLVFPAKLSCRTSLSSCWKLAPHKHWANNSCSDANAPVNVTPAIMKMWHTSYVTHIAASVACGPDAPNNHSLEDRSARTCR